MRIVKLFVLLIWLMPNLNAQVRFEYDYRQMGTQIRLVFYTKDRLKADVVAKAAFARIDELNAKLSDYLVDSELRKLCARSGHTVAVSNDLFRILRSSVEVSLQTTGAFDVSAGPLIALWRKARKTGLLPKTSELTMAKRKVGYRYITLLGENKVLLEMEGMALDLGAIGKGFTADEVMKIFTSAGINSALVDMGGDILVSGPPPNTPYWSVAFTYFNTEGFEVVQKIQLKDQAVATSGDLYQFVEIGGVRYSHIIDPRSGMALSNGAQVTVIAPSATTADAYASAYSVMGIDSAALNFNEAANLKVFIVENNGIEYKKWMSPDFADYMAE